MFICNKKQGRVRTRRWRTKIVRCVFGRKTSSKRRSEEKGDTVTLVSLIAIFLVTVTHGTVFENKIIFEAKRGFQSRKEFSCLKFDLVGVFLLSGHIRYEISWVTSRCEESKCVSISLLIKHWLKFLSSAGLDGDKLVGLSVFLVQISSWSEASEFVKRPCFVQQSTFIIKI